MKKILLLLFITFSANVITQAQIGIGTNSPNPSSIVDISSTSKGLLIPRMTLSERAAVTPVTGLLIYQTDNTPGFYFYNGSEWKSFQDNLGNHSMTSNLITNSFNIARNPSVGVGIKMLDSGAVSIYTDNEYPGASSSKALRFKFDQWGSLIMLGDLGIGFYPTNVNTTEEKLMWLPYKAAFRAGSTLDAWNFDEKIGYYSAAMGYNTTAQGNGSFAMGMSTTSTGLGSVSFGSNTVSSGKSSFAAGTSSKAFTDNSIAMGNSSVASGTSGIAIGYLCNADGNYSVAIGNRANTNNHTGAFAFADASIVDSVENSADNQFMTRFAGGYRLFTNATMTVGVGINPGGSSWNVISDVRRKENFETSDNENFLIKLRKIELGSWNYKGQDVKTFRHYGPMAQDIFAAYGKDKFGTIGCDTLLASADMDGIMMILIKGLEQRTTEQKRQFEAQQQLELKQDEKIKLLEAEIKRLSSIISKQQQ
ncbi:tail fiber domain-containing protein [Ferruginibacter sp. SUN002]|uniref:tail fiber domain-containing protein n=1 Tax=Ferruginibacter sp. SUN002 TaxID=2937789 RepID=UPI003D362E6A